MCGMPKAVRTIVAWYSGLLAAGFAAACPAPASVKHATVPAATATASQRCRCFDLALILHPLPPWPNREIGSGFNHCRRRGTGSAGASRLGAILALHNNAEDRAEHIPGGISQCQLFAAGCR